MSEFVEVASEDQVGEGEGIAVSAFGHRIALFRHQGALYALSARCPHAGGPLEEGYLKDDYVICPWHGSRFRLASGEVTGGPAQAGVPSFPVEVVEGKVMVGPPPPGTEPPPPSLF